MKKYEVIKDLSLIIPDLLTTLFKDFKGDKKLVKWSYVITTDGGNTILWQVQERDELIWTVSTDSVEIITVRKELYHIFRHYVLSEAGQKWLKEKIVEELI